ncbi:hypothetical protein H2203_006702 [Taxawa tesnikishii (nom. ined.)]|nr:hypothetical protein H2203_006702 [Dothideales sp. JES 119]
MNIRTFAFNRSVAQRLSPGTAIFAVSSALGDDAENMDASLLMSSEYMQPLVPSELQALTLQLLEPENIQWLRHCAVRKFLQWRREEVGHSLDLQKQQLLAPPALGTPTISAAAAAASGAGASNPSQVLVPYATSAAWYGSRLQAREKEPLAQVRLAKWAEDLQRSLDRGRREQRPAWRLGEGVVVDVDVDVGVSPPLLRASTTRVMGIGRLCVSSTTSSGRS